MKKAIVLFVFTFIFVGCGKTVSPDDISKISKGMSEDKVIEILGKPNERTTDRENLSQGEFSGAASINAEKNEQYDDYSPILTALENKENVEGFKYKTNEEKHNIYIFFLDGKVKYFFNL